MVLPLVLQPVLGWWQWLPSRTSHPQLMPGPGPSAESPARSISSHSPWPTSPIQRSSLAPSNEKRHGFLSPYCQISFFPVAPTKGFDDGTPYGLLPVRPSTSMRSILPRSVSFRRPRFFGSSLLPPPPDRRYRFPSGPKRSMPPLWFVWAECSIRRTSRAVSLLTRLGSAFLALYSRMTMSPSPRVKKT